MEKHVLVISDCHLSAGRFFEGNHNPHEDFHSDDEMVDLFRYFSSGAYGTGPEGPVPVELVIAGDFLDFLNVPYKGEFEDFITEEVSLERLEAILAGHPKVMEAIKTFASLPEKSVTYLIGNHDADLFFPGVRERITRAWSPEGQYPCPKVKVVADRDHLKFEGGVEIHHGNQMEVGSCLDFGRPLLTAFLEKPVLNIPWSSYYVLKIVNRLKWEREYIDKVRPIKIFILFNILLDPWFTLRYCFLSGFYFLKTRFSARFRPGSRLRETVEIIKQEGQFFLDLEREARQFLTLKAKVKTLIVGHTHRPMNKIYSDGKQYINTGTWTRMINLDWRSIGRQEMRTFALVHIKDGVAQCELRQWVGEHLPHRRF